MSRRSPTLRTVTLASANVNFILLTLLQALDSQILRRAQSIQLQLDQSAGAANLFIGNPVTLSASDYGVALVATQAWSIPSLESNLILLDDIALRTDTPGVRVNVAIVVR